MNVEQCDRAVSALLPDSDYLSMLGGKAQKRYHALIRFRRILGPEKYQEWHEKVPDDVIAAHPVATCKTCKETKPRAEFNNKPEALNGLTSHCRACEKVLRQRRACDRKAVKP